MNKITKNILLYLTVSLLLGVSSCSDKLNVYPKDQVLATQVKANDVSSLINGVYSKLRFPISYWYLRFLSEDLSSDNLVYRATFFQHGEVDNNAILASNVLNDRYYNGSYYIIQAANDVINMAKNSDLGLSVAEKNKKISDAYYIRAFAYFELVKLYGGVPIIENRDLDKQIVPRKTEDEVYNYIIKDLSFVKDNGADFSNPARASKQAAKALLARIYLIRKNYQKAYDLATDLVADTHFELADNYNKIWNDMSNKEHIFYCKHTTLDGTGSHGFFLRYSTMTGGGRAELPVDTTLVNAYEKGDTRKGASVVEYDNENYDKKFHWFCNKYRDSGDNTSPFYVSRIAEMYLIQSEASLMLSKNPKSDKVLNPINTLRKSRGLGELTSADIYVIQHERRVELAFEGVRWSDMKRTPSKTNPSKSMAEVFVESKGRTSNDLLYPIPTSAMDANKLLKQNPGY